VGDPEPEEQMKTARKITLNLLSESGCSQHPTIGRATSEQDYCSTARTRAYRNGRAPHD
jgi:hypothetical protein